MTGFPGCCVVTWAPRKHLRNWSLERAGSVGTVGAKPLPTSEVPLLLRVCPHSVWACPHPHCRIGASPSASPPRPISGPFFFAFSSSCLLLAKSLTMKLKAIHSTQTLAVCSSCCVPTPDRHRAEEPQPSGDRCAPQIGDGPFLGLGKAGVATLAVVA